MKLTFKSMVLLSPLFLLACSKNADVSEQFNNSVHYNVDQPDQEIVFYDGSLQVDPESPIKPFISKADLKEMQENSNIYETQIFEEVKVFNTENNTYEVVDQSSMDTILTFTYDEASQQLVWDDTVYSKMN